MMVSANRPGNFDAERRNADMRRKRTLSQLEIQWVNSMIQDLCIQNNLSPQDDEYRSAAWEAFVDHYHHHPQVWNPTSFWPCAISHMDHAIQKEKCARSQYLYQLLSLDTPLSQDSDNPGTLLDLLPIQGDFTNGTAFRDFICRLPSDLYALSSRLLNRDSLEEARSDLGWDCHRLCNAVAQLRKHMTEYEQI